MSFNNNIRFETAMLPFLITLTVFLYLRYATSAKVSRSFRTLSLSTLLAATAGIVSHMAGVTGTLPVPLLYILFTVYYGLTFVNAYHLMRYVAAYVEFDNKRVMTGCRLVLGAGLLMLTANLATRFVFSIGENRALVKEMWFTPVRAFFVFFFLGAAFLLHNLYQQESENAQFILTNLLMFLLIDAFVIQYLFSQEILITYVAATVLLYLTFFYLEAPALQALSDAEEEMIRLVEEKEHSVQRTHAASRAKSEFLANTSHEIRTPMNAILGMNEMIATEADDEETLKASCDIKEAGEGLLSIINNILDIARIESGKMDIFPVEFFLSEVIDDLTALFENRIREKGLVFYTEINKDLPEHLYGDGDALRRIVVNLLDNAVKYTDEGQITLHILGGRAKGESASVVHLEIMVEDSGIGMREEEMARLFEAFERVNLKETQSIRGAGLGLTLVSRRTKMMGGEVRVESIYGEGSAFMVEVPMRVMTEGFTGTIAEYEQMHAQREEESARDAAGEEMPLLEGRRILLVDDTPVNLTVAKGMLAPTRARIDTALSGEEALDMALAKRYDLILLDHQMPGMDGIETLRHLREEGRENASQASVVIALTANTGGGAQHYYLEQGFDGYLAKPLQRGALTRALALIR